MHLAAESHVDRSIDRLGRVHPAPTSSAPTRCSRRRAPTGARCAAPARDAFRFLHVSTDEVYGSLGPAGIFAETTPYDPRSPYSASKAAVRPSGARLARDLRACRPSSPTARTITGPYHFPEKLIPLIILNALEGKPLPVYGDGHNIRDWLYVEDHARALVAGADASGRPGETYNVGGRSERTNLEVVQRDLRHPRRARAGEPAAPLR